MVLSRTGLTVVSVLIASSAWADPVSLQISQVEPDFGPVAGGTTLAVSGTGFSSECKVQVGSAECAVAANGTSEKIRCTTFAATAGKADVVVTCGQTQTKAESAFEYYTALALTSPLPAIVDGYTLMMGASGGVAPYRYTIANQTAYSNTGCYQIDRFSGILSSKGCNGYGSVTIQVEDSIGETTTRSVDAAQPMSFSAMRYASLNPGATADVNSFASGGVPPYSFQLVSGPAVFDAGTAKLTAGTETSEVVLEATDAIGEKSTTTLLIVAHGYAGTPAYSETRLQNLAMFSPMIIETNTGDYAILGSAEEVTVKTRKQDYMSDVSYGNAHFTIAEPIHASGETPVTHSYPIDNSYSETLSSYTRQDDGKFLLVGSSKWTSWWNWSDSSEGALVRINADFSQDKFFGKDGSKRIPFRSGAEENLHAAVTNYSGTIWVVGDSCKKEKCQSFISKLNSNGDVLGSFALNADVDYSIDSYNDNHRSALINKISDTDFLVIYTTDSGVEMMHGRFDAPARFSSLQFFGEFAPAAQNCLPQSSGVFGGVIVQAVCLLDHQGNQYNYGNVFKRFNMEGTLDTHFGNGGSVLPFEKTGIGQEYQLTKFTFQTDGKILIPGVMYGNYGAWGVLRLNTDGSPDQSFGFKGVSDASSAGVDVAVSEDGTINLLHVSRSNSYDGYDEFGFTHLVP